jgi:hypothetical protein
MKLSIIQRETRVCAIRVAAKEMAGGGEVLNTKMNYVKRKRKKKIIWNRGKNNKLKNEVGYIQSLKEAYKNVRLVISEHNL